MPSENPAQPLGFVFAIKPRFDAAGNVSAYDVQSQILGLPEEIVTTIVRTWLRAEEEKYFKRFTSQH